MPDEPNFASKPTCKQPHNAEILANAREVGVRTIAEFLVAQERRAVFRRKHDVQVDLDQ